MNEWMNEWKKDGKGERKQHVSLNAKKKKITRMALCLKQTRKNEWKTVDGKGERKQHVSLNEKKIRECIASLKKGSGKER